MREHCLSVSTDCAYVAPQWQFWDRKKVFNLKLLKTETQLNVHIRETGVHDSFSYFLKKKKKRKPHVLMGFTHTQTHTLIELILCMSDFCNQVCLTFVSAVKYCFFPPLHLSLQSSLLHEKHCTQKYIKHSEWIGSCRRRRKQKWYSSQKNNRLFWKCHFFQTACFFIIFFF